MRLAGIEECSLAEARETLATFLGAGSDEICFGPNMTTITFHVARVLGQKWGDGDAVVVTELDHHANVVPWQALTRERGIRVRVVRMEPETGQIDWGDLERALCEPGVRLLAMGAASNALGTVNDVARAGRLARSARVLLYVDAVHYAPHASIDVRRMGCDFLACSAYKFYGPHVGVLYGRRDLLSLADAPRIEPAAEGAARQLETGTQNHEGIVGAAAAVLFLGALAGGNLDLRLSLERVIEVLHARGDAQARLLWEGLSAIRGVRLYGPSPGKPRTSTIVFTLEGWISEQVAKTLAGQDRKSVV